MPGLAHGKEQESWASPFAIAASGAAELAGLTWADVDFRRRLITVQRSFDGPTKADDVRCVPILDALLPTLRARRLRDPLEVVFPSRAGTGFGPSARIFQEVLHRVLDRSKFPTVHLKGKSRRCITFHCLRHYADPRVMPTRSVRRAHRRAVDGTKAFLDAA